MGRESQEALDKDNSICYSPGPINNIDFAQYFPDSYTCWEVGLR